MDDLLCLENIKNEYDNDVPLRQKYEQLLQQTSTTENIASPCSNSSSSLLSSNSSISSSSTTCSSAASSGYNSATSSHAGYIRSSSSGSSSSNDGSVSSACTIVVCNCQGNCSIVQSIEPQTTTDVVHANDYEQQYDAQQQPAEEQQQQQSNAIYNVPSRTLENVNTATVDPTFLSDRCLENALKVEDKRSHPLCTYFTTVQKDITPPMRKIVAEWMMEVCAEEKCQEEVVLLALNYMDRFLSTKSVRKTHLQILAAACLLLASKLREPSCRALSAELLVFYTDNSIYKDDLIKWELIVLSRLGWDLASVTPLDFLELLLIRLPIRCNKYPDLSIDKVRQHAQAFISLAAKEHHFYMYSASQIAASSIAAALSGLNWHLRTGHNLRYLLNILTDLTSVAQDYLHDCMMQMESIFEEHSRNLQPYLVSVDASQQMQHHQHNHHQCHKQQQQQQKLQQQHSAVKATVADTTQHYHQHCQHCQPQSQYQHFCHYHHNHVIYCHQHHSQQQQSQHHHNHYHQQQQLQHAQAQRCYQHDSNAAAAAAAVAAAAAAASIVLPNLTQTCKMQANAHTDVQDIKF